MTRAAKVKHVREDVGVRPVRALHARELELHYVTGIDANGLAVTRCGTHGTAVSPSTMDDYLPRCQCAGPR